MSSPNSETLTTVTEQVIAQKPSQPKSADNKGKGKAKELSPAERQLKQKQTRAFQKVLSAVRAELVELLVSKIIEDRSVFLDLSHYQLSYLLGQYVNLSEQLSILDEEGKDCGLKPQRRLDMLMNPKFQGGLMNALRNRLEHEGFSAWLEIQGLDLAEVEYRKAKATADRRREEADAIAQKTGRRPRINYPKRLDRNRERGPTVDVIFKVNRPKDAGPQVLTLWDMMTIKAK